MKRASSKVTIIVLLTGLIAICGNLFLKYNLSTIIKDYNEIENEYRNKRECMTSISGLLYHHQNLIGNCLLAYSDDMRQQYINEANAEEATLISIMNEFGKTMNGGKNEQVFHELFSKFTQYRGQVANLFFYINENDIDTAIYYNNGELASAINKMNEILNQLDQMTQDDINTTKQKLQHATYLSTISTAVSTGIVIFLTILSAFICFKITGNLDHYKRQLEEKLILKNKQLLLRNEKTMALQDSIIIGIANLIEDRDGDTGEHVRRTSAYVQMLAKELQRQGYYSDILTDKYISRLTKAAPLHDIGKIMISDNILLKPGKLTNEEFEIMKTHAALGGQIIHETFTQLEDQKYVKIAEEVARHHHERWDGTGYPDHLSGNDIPLGARIMAIADVFDALVSKRCYKEPMSKEQAFEIIKDSSGTHFDPTLVVVFLGLKDEILQFLSNEPTERK